MKKLLSTIAIVGLVGAGVGAYFEYGRVPESPRVTQLDVTQGDIVEAAIATGTLQATRTVPVGTQVSGTVQHLYVDFNSIVTAGQVIARIDPSLSESALNSAKASVDRATIDLDQQQETLATDEKNFERTDSLFTHELATAQEREAAELLVEEDKAVLDEDKAAITVANAGVLQAQVNLDHCVITSPIDGLVLSRAVDEGQTVAASVATPTLYVLATDLKTLELVGDVDESDVGRIRPAQHVTFTVDAYPTRVFTGAVKTVRLNPTNVSNVVTYQVVIGVSNPDLRLMPGMTASLKVEVSRANGVTRVPNVALRYRPSNEVFAAFGQTPPPVQPQPRTVTPAVAAPTAARTPASRDSNASTIDVMFAPMPHPETNGQVWVFDANHQLTRVPLRLGVTDGTWTEVLSGGVELGNKLVTNIVVPVGAPHPAVAPPVSGAAPAAKASGTSARPK